MVGGGWVETGCPNNGGDTVFPQDFLDVLERCTGEACEIDPGCITMRINELKT